MRGGRARAVRDGQCAPGCARHAPRTRGSRVPTVWGVWLPVRPGRELRGFPCGPGVRPWPSGAALRRALSSVQVAGRKRPPGPCRAWGCGGGRWEEGRGACPCLGNARAQLAALLQTWTSVRTERRAGRPTAGTCPAPTPASVTAATRSAPRRRPAEVRLPAAHPHQADAHVHEYARGTPCVLVYARAFVHPCVLGTYNVLTRTVPHTPTREPVCARPHIHTRACSPHVRPHVRPRLLGLFSHLPRALCLGLPWRPDFV